MRLTKGSHLKFSWLLLTLIFWCAFFITIRAQEPVSCGFRKDTLTFSGNSDLENAKCLLREVKQGGILGPKLQTLPDPLERLIGRPVAANVMALNQLKNELRRYLAAQVPAITEAEIGGSVDAPLSRARNNQASAPLATYFVIHDTSTPNMCDVSGFPDDVNSPTWVWKGISWNNPDLHRNSSEAHLYITRDGRSIAPLQRSFGTPWRATKLEGPRTDERAKGLFLHIENVQPRRCGEQPSARCYRTDPKTHKLVCREDSKIGPDPGLSDAQMDRLALVYLAASIRRNQWLVPAFHATVDAGISSGHDDPQNFSLARWAIRLCSLLQTLQQECSNR